MLTLPGTGIKMNTEAISGGTHDTEHNQGVFLANADGSRITPTVDAQNRLDVVSNYTSKSGGGAVTLGAHTYSAGFQVGAPHQVATALPAGMYDVHATVFDSFGALADTAVVWLFNTDQTANLGGDGTSWDATGITSGPSVISGFDAFPFSTAAPTKKILDNGHVHNALSGDQWVVAVGGSGLVAAGTETVGYSLFFTLVGDVA